MKLERNVLKKIAYGIVAACLIATAFFAKTAFAREDSRQYNILFLGDSLIGQYRDETSVPYLVGEGLECEVFNGAFGGSSLTGYLVGDSDYLQRSGLNFMNLVRAICSKDFGVQQSLYVHENGTEEFPYVIDFMEQIDVEKLDVLILEYGLNDYFAGVSVENKNDPYDLQTFVGNFRTSIEMLRETYPELRILIVSPTYVWYWRTEQDCETIKFGGSFLRDYVNVLEKLSAEYDLEYLDLFNLYTEREGYWETSYYYTEDGIHPNETGRQMMADEIVAYLKETGL